MFTEKILKGDERSILIRKNIIGSLIIKGWSCIIQFLIVPITLLCLNQYEYGIWLTINSILVGIDSFDIGLGNGMRNKLAEDMAKKDYDNARKDVSTTFFMLIFIIVILLSFTFLFIYNVDVHNLLNIRREDVSNIDIMLYSVLTIVGTNFILKIVGNVYLALQLPAINNLIIVIGQTLSLIFVYIISNFHRDSLTLVAIAYTIAPLISYTIAFIVTFYIKYTHLCPSPRFFDRNKVKDLLGLGIEFFICQISTLVLMVSSNMIISKEISPTEVTPYQLAYRYFSIVLMIFAIISSPLWSATTDAYTKGDWTWIKKAVKKSNIILVGCAILLFCMVLFSKIFYSLWIGESVFIPTLLSILTSVYILVLVVSTCFSNIIFGIGKIRLITIVTLVQTIIFIPLCIALIRLWNIYGVLVALISVTMMCMITNIIQYHKISNNTAVGIWNK